MIRPPRCSRSTLSTIAGVGALVLALGAPIVGAVYVVNEREELLRERSQEMKALARLRVDQVSTWFDERMQDAQFVRRNEAIAAEALLRSARRTVADPSDWMRAMFRNGQYRAITMRRPDGALLTSFPARSSDRELDPSLLRRAVETQAVVVGDLQRSENGEERMHLYVPLRTPRSPAASDPAGVVVFDIDPTDRLYPIVRSWPVPSRSAKSILFRAVDDSVEYLGPDMISDLESPEMKVPVTLPDLPEARAVHGYQGIMNGVDARGVEVISYVSPVPRTPWLMATKIDRAEVLDRWREERTFVIVASGIAMLFAISTLVMMRRLASVRLGEVQTRYQTDIEAIRRHQSEMMDLANDIVILSDGEDRILQANRMAASFYGSTADQLIGRTVASLRWEGGSAEYQQSFARLSRRGQLRYSDAHRSAGGRRFDVEVSARHLEIDGRTYIQRIIRDVTDRLTYEAELRRMNRIRKVLSAVNRLISREHDEARLLHGVCRTAVTEAALPLVWIGKANEDRTEIIPVAAAGVAAPHASTIRIPLTPGSTSLGFDGSGLRSGAPIIIDDLERDVRGRIWRDDARVYGLRSVAVVPVLVEGVLWGVVSFVTAEASSMAREELELLEEIATDISFALTALRSRQERLDAERRLDEQHAISLALFENSGEAILFTDPAGKVLSMNPEALNLFGRTVEELPLLQRGDLVDLTDPRLAPALAERQRTGRFCGELRLRRSDGSFFPAEVSSVVFALADGELRSSMTIRDISARRESEQVMQSQFRELRRWHDLTLERETRVMELKREVNALLRSKGASDRYSCVTDENDPFGVDEHRHPKKLELSVGHDRP